MRNKLSLLFIENKATFFVYAALFFGMVILLIDYKTGDLFNPSFWDNVLVEAHGMFMDIILFGIILTLYERFTDKHSEIKRLHEEIDDYRGWNEPEAMYRIVGCIKRLNKKGVTNIDLTDCFLENANLENVNLRESNLSNTNLKRADLKGANLEYIKNENYLDLEEADLQGTIFKSARHSKVNYHTLFNVYLKGAKISNLEELENINKLSNSKYKARLVKSFAMKYYEIL